MNTRFDLLSKNEYVIDSALSIIKYDDTGNIINSSVVNAPLSFSGDINNEDIKIRLYELLYRCLNFTSKFCGVDELTGEHFDDDKLNLYVLSYVHIYNKHHCAGNIMYHPKNEYILKWMDIMFLKEYDIIPLTNLSGKKINILRSSGDIDSDGYINKKDGLIWNKKNNDYMIRVSLENGMKEKCVILSKILKYNPELELEIFLLEKSYFKGSPDWVLETYDDWINGINKLKFGPKEIKITFVKQYENKKIDI